MYQVDEKPETIHLYVVREEEKRPYTATPLFFVFLCLTATVALTIYSSLHPFYVHERLTIPAQFLPPRVFTARAPIIPTGIKTYPAVASHGILTITNGSIIGQVIPGGFTIDNVAIDYGVYVPSGNANGYGYAEVAAHALQPGKSGNIPADTIDQVEGSSVYIRNLSAFSGGRDSYSVKFITPQDKSVALMKSRNLLTSLVTGLHYPCSEQVSGALTITWRCQFVTFKVPSYMRVTAVTLSGKNFLVDVTFTLRPMRVWVK